MKLSHDEMLEIIAQDGKYSAMRYEFCRQMNHVWYIVLGGSVLISAIIIVGIFKKWQVQEMSFLVGTISGSVVALAGVLSGIATAGKVQQVGKENAGTEK